MKKMNRISVQTRRKRGAPAPDGGVPSGPSLDPGQRLLPRPAPSRPHPPLLSSGRIRTDTQTSGLDRKLCCFGTVGAVAEVTCHVAKSKAHGRGRGQMPKDCFVIFVFSLWNSKTLRQDCPRSGGDPRESRTHASCMERMCPKRYLWLT